MLFGTLRKNTIFSGIFISFLYANFCFANEAEMTCLRDAVNTMPLSGYYYSFYYKDDQDIRVIENITSNNIGVIFFSPRMTNEANILPSYGYYSPVLFMQSLIRQMCPTIRTRAKYNRNAPKGFYDYLLFQTTEED